MIFWVTCSNRTSVFVYISALNNLKKSFICYRQREVIPACGTSWTVTEKLPHIYKNKQTSPKQINNGTYKFEWHPETFTCLSRIVDRFAPYMILWLNTSSICRQFNMPWRRLNHFLNLPNICIGWILTTNLYSGFKIGWNLVTVVRILWGKKARGCHILLTLARNIWS